MRLALFTIRRLSVSRAKRVLPGLGIVQFAETYYSMRRAITSSLSYSVRVAAMRTQFALTLLVRVFLRSLHHDADAGTIRGWHAARCREQRRGVSGARQKPIPCRTFGLSLALAGVCSSL